MSIDRYSMREVFTDLDVEYGGRPRLVTVEWFSSGTNAELTIRGIGQAIRLVLERDAMHVLAGAFTRSLNNVRRSNRLRGIGGFTSTDEVTGWTVRRGRQNQQLDVSLEATADLLTVTVTGLTKRPISFNLDPEDIRFMTWFLSKGLFNVGRAQRIRR